MIVVVRAQATDEDEDEDEDEDDEEEPAAELTPKVGMLTCSLCKASKPNTGAFYSKSQVKKKAAAKCKDCIAAQ